MVMHHSDMRTMMQINSIAPSAEGAYPVQNHLQDPFSTQQPFTSPDIAGPDVSDVDEIEEIDADAPTNETQQAIGMGQETDALHEFYKGTGLEIEAKKNLLAGMKVLGIYTIMKNNLTQEQIKYLTDKYNLKKTMKKLTIGGTINDFAKDLFQDER